MNLLYQNKKIEHEYHVEASYEAGIVLLGSEVRAVKNKEFTALNCFGVSSSSSIDLVNLSIKLPSGLEEKRQRRLLLNSREISQIQSKLQLPGHSFVLHKIYETDRGLIKVQMSIVKGKKQYDKRESIKIKDLKRQEARNGII